MHVVWSWIRSFLNICASPIYGAWLVRCGQGNVLAFHWLFSEMLAVSLYLNWNKNSYDGDVGGEHGDQC